MDQHSNLCPVTAVQNTLMGKWKLIILWILHAKTRRFNELEKRMPTISHGVLAQQLKELERDNLITRKSFNEVPPKVEYSLTEIGISFIPIMTQMMEWGATYVSKTSNCNMDICVENDFPCSKCHDLMQPDNINL